MNSRYRKTLTQALDEVKIRSLYMKGKEKESVEVIAKKLGMSIKDVRKLMGEANIDVDNVQKGDSDKEKELKIKLDKEKDTDNLERQLIAAQGQIKVLQQKLENEKNKAIKPEPNPDTGEVPLTIGVANAEFTKKKEKVKNGEVKEADLSKAQIKKVHKMADELPKKDFKDRYGKKQGDAVRYATATNIVKKKEGIKEDGHEDVSSSKRMCQTIIEDATQIKSKLDSMGPEDKLDTWWTNKLAKSADNLNSARDYIVNPIEEDLQEQSMRQKAVAIAKKMAGNMTGAVKEIEKLMKGLSNDPVVATTLKRVNENLEEKIKPFMISYSKHGQHAGFKDADSLPEIQKMAQDLRKRGFTIDKMGRYNPPVKEELSMKATFKNGVDKTFKGKTASDINKQVKEYEKKHNTGLQHDGPMVKEENLQEFTRSQLDTLEKQYSDLKGKTISMDQANKLRKIFDRIPDAFLNDLRKRKIPFLSGLALSRMIQKGMPVREQIEEKKLMVKKGDKVREINDFEWRTYSQMGYKLIGKDGDVMKEDRYAGARKVFETITAVKNKAEKSGMPYSVLKKVYDRGMAAWKGGHRPGTTQQQWALARVNSFITKSSGTWGGADKDLAAKVRGSKK